MKAESQLRYTLLGALGLALVACGGDDAATPAGGPDAGGGENSGGGGAEASGGRSGSGGATASGGSTASGGMSSGGTGGGDGGAGGSDEAGPGVDAATEDAGDPGSDGSPPADAAVGEEGGAVGDGGVQTDGGNGGDAGGPRRPRPAGVVAYAYASQQSASTAYSPAAAYSFNAYDGAITIDRTGTGIYSLDFADLGAPIRNAQVTPYAFSGYCILTNFGSDSAVVRCFDNDGTLTDARFTFAAFGPVESNGKIVAYAMADQPAAAQYGPNANYSYNTAGGSMVARRSAAGTYELEFGDLTLGTGNVQVTARETDHHCGVQNWTGNSVFVRCYDSDGALADASYLVMVLQERRADGASILAHVRTTSSDDAASDLTQAQWTHNSSGYGTDSERPATGEYQVNFTGLDFSTAHPQVSAYLANRHCGIAQYGADWVKVRCYDAAGVPANSLFSLIVVE